MPLATVVRRIDPTGSNPLGQTNAAVGFRMGVARITGDEYENALALSRESRALLRSISPPKRSNRSSEFRPVCQFSHYAQEGQRTHEHGPGMVTSALGAFGDRFRRPNCCMPAPGRHLTLRDVAGMGADHRTAAGRCGSRHRGARIREQIDSVARGALSWAR